MQVYLSSMVSLSYFHISKCPWLPIKDSGLGYYPPLWRLPKLGVVRTNFSREKGRLYFRLQHWRQLDRRRYEGTSTLSSYNTRLFHFTLPGLTRLRFHPHNTNIEPGAISPHNKAVIKTLQCYAVRHTTQQSCHPNLQYNGVRISSSLTFTPLDIDGRKYLAIRS